MAQQYRAIVIGCGAIRAATTCWLSRGAATGCSRSSSTSTGTPAGHRGPFRVIRHAYSRPEYTALTPAAYQSWNVAEQGTGLQFVYRTGGLVLADGGSEVAATCATPPPR